LLLFFTSRDEPVIATFVCVENIVGPFGKQENSKSNVTPPNGLKPLIKCCFWGEKQYKYLGFNLLVKYSLSLVMFNLYEARILELLLKSQSWGLC